MLWHEPHNLPFLSAVGTVITIPASLTFDAHPKVYMQVRLGLQNGKVKGDWKMESKKINIVVAVLFLLGAFFSAQSLALAVEKGMKSEKQENGMQSQMKGKEGTRETASMTEAIRFSKLKDVENRDNEKLGTVKDVVIDRSGHNAFLIVEHGGALGVNAKYTPIPWKDAQFREKDGNMVAFVNISKDRFDKAPTFSENEWPNLASKKYDRKLYNYYASAKSYSGAAESMKHNTEQKQQSEQNKY